MSERCIECGRFIGRSDSEAMYWVPWGSSTDFSPPEPRHYHGKCWLKVDAITREELSRPGNAYVTARKLHQLNNFVDDKEIKS